MPPDVPPATANAAPEWSVVEAWMVAEKAGYKKTAAHWGVPLHWVTYRAQAARRKGGGPPVVKPLGSRGPGVAWTAPFPPAAAPRRELVPIEAFAPQVRQNLRDGVEGIGMMLARVKRAELALVEVEGMRAKLRAEGIEAGIAADRCPLPAMPRMSEVDAATRALRCVLDSVSGLAGFDAETGGTGETGGVTEEDEAAILRSMRPAKGPKLELVAPLVGRGEGR